MATETALPPVVPAEIPIAVDAGTLPGDGELAQFRAARAKGQMPAPVAPAPDSPPAPAPVAQTDEDDDAVGNAPPVAPSPKNRRVSQEYLNELVAARARAELLVEQMEGRLKALETGKGESAPAPEYTRPKPQESEVGTKYATYGDYVEDVADWKVEQREAARTRTEQASAAQATEQSALAAYQSRLPAARARHADFDEVIGRPLPAPLTPTLRSALVASEIGPDLAYHLTTHPDEYLRLRALPVGVALMAIGRLEAQLQAGFTPAAAAPPVQTPLPAPMAPVGGHVTTGTPDAATADLATFRAAIKPKFGMRG